MDRSNIIYLIASTQTQDENGVWREEFTRRQVYCQIDSVTAQEFFEGGRNGLNPSYRMIVFYADYEGETMLEYLGNTYSIYRTYHRRDDMMELYVERKGGSNGPKGNAGQPGSGGQGNP